MLSKKNYLRMSSLLNQLLFKTKIIIGVDVMLGVKLLFNFLVLKMKRGTLSLYGKKDFIIMSFLDEVFGDLVMSWYTDNSKPEDVQKESLSPAVWVYWDELPPPIVKACIDSIRRNSENRDFRIVSANTVNQYLTIDKIILEKYHSGKISKTHFSDIVRFFLLSKYGGCWIDATTLLTKPIPGEYFNLDFFTIKTLLPNSESIISRGKWSVSFVICKNTNLLLKLTERFIQEYWTRYNSLFDYLWIDYFWAYCYDRIPEVKRMIDCVPYTNPYVYSLSDYTKVISEEEFRALIDKEDNFLYKMSAKSLLKYSKEIDNKRQVPEKKTLTDWIINLS